VRTRADANVDVGFVRLCWLRFVAGLTDYEVRDLNDEINRLLREKRHWENQIVALGGANYKRNVAMLDDDGKEVPGTKGYKYFGRAKDLPGVRELFQSKKGEEEEENQAFAYYKKFVDHGPSYYGDLDEADGKLLTYEAEVEEEDWQEAYTNVREALHLSKDDVIPRIQPSYPVPTAPPLSEPPPAVSSEQKAESKGIENDVEMAGPEGEEAAKKTSGDGNKDGPRPAATTAMNLDTVLEHARVVVSHVTFLDPASLVPPKLPTREEMESILLDLRKKALVEEYFGDK